MWENVIYQLIEAITLPFQYFILPEKRINILYLVSSFALAYLTFKRLKPSISFYKYIFNKKIWFSKSALTDYKIFFLNSFIKVFLLSFFVVGGIGFQQLIRDYLIHQFGTLSININRSSLVICYTISLWIIDDFGSFFIHYLMHKVPLLWRFHKTHHSATVLNPITQYRIHPIELTLNNLKSTFVFGLVTGVFFYLANETIGIIAFLGVNLFKFLFLFFGANLRHSHVKLEFPSWLENIIISPFQHQIHHSNNPLHFDKNIGSHLAIWDKLFGTLLKSKEVGKIKFGLDKKEQQRFKSTWQNLISPFKY